MSFYEDGWHKLAEQQAKLKSALETCAELLEGFTSDERGNQNDDIVEAVKVAREVLAETTTEADT